MATSAAAVVLFAGTAAQQGSALVEPACSIPNAASVDSTIRCYATDDLQRLHIAAMTTEGSDLTVTRYEIDGVPTQAQVGKTPPPEEQPFVLEPADEAAMRTCLDYLVPEDTITAPAVAGDADALAAAVDACLVSRETQHSGWLVIGAGVWSSGLQRSTRPY